MSALTETELLAQGPHTRAMPLMDYHLSPGVSKSTLDWVSKSTALVQWNRNAPEDTEADSAVDLGTAFHALLLEPDLFGDQYVRDFEPPLDAIATVDQLKAALDARGLSYKASATKRDLTAALLSVDPQAPVVDSLRGEWERGTRGRIVLTRAEWRKINLMWGSAMAHPTVKLIFAAEGHNERCHYWTDELTGLLCRSRPDREIPKLGMLLDVKTAARIDRFESSILEYRYHVQDRFYSEGYHATQGEPPKTFVFLIVSSTLDRRKYPVRLKQITTTHREIAAAAIRQDLATYAAAKKADDWNDVETAELPPWFRMPE